jgi:hypothetical protein
LTLKSAGSGSFEKIHIVHIIIGGTICLFTTFLLVDIAQTFLIQILVNLGIVGVMVYADEFQIATMAFIFGLAFVVGGFLGGLYTGYQISENLRTVLLLPALISTFGFALILVLFAGYTVDISFTGLIVMQLLGNAAGSYLGGYTLNWAVKEEKTGEKLTLELGD